MKSQPFVVIVFVTLTILTILCVLYELSRSNQGGWTEHVESRRFSNGPASRSDSIVGNDSTDNERRGLDYGTSPVPSQDSSQHHMRSLCDWAAPQNPIHLWMNHYSTILAASRLSLDEHYALQNITARVLQEVTARLPRSVKVLPTTDFSEVMEKLERRYLYLLDPDSFTQEPPPVTIAVVGGRVTEGNKCNTNVKGLEMKSCAWPSRLDEFIHSLAQRTLPSTASATKKLVTVQSLAIGGTNTLNGSFWSNLVSGLTFQI